MAKKLSSKQKKEELNKLFAQYNVRLGMLYSSYVKKLASLGYGEDVLEGDALFNFDNFPELKARLDDIFADYFKDSVLCFKQGMTDGVALAFSHDTGELGGFSVLSDKSIKALRNATATAFISSRLKTEKGLNLSQRIWNYCQQAKSEFEMAMSNVIADGIKSGTSAEDIARNIKQYLNDPDRMYRRYHTVKVLKNGKKKDVVTWRRRRVIDGKVRFIEEPLENVGTGVYRSSRMNTLRVARTEINAAYLRGHNARWAKEPFVIGQWIHRSPQHKIEDICDELEGRYPKQFIFAGWHPSCMCTADPIMIEGEERKRFYDRLYAGEDMSNYVSPHNIDNVPDNYKQYILNNESKIISALKKDKLAWHLADNQKYWQKLCSDENQKLMGLKTISTKERIMQIAKKRHEQRTQEEIDKIQKQWTLRRSANYMEGMNKAISNLTYSNKNDLIGEALTNRYNAVLDALKDSSTWSVANVEKVYQQFIQGVNIRERWDKLVWDGFLKEQIANCREIENILGIKKGRPMSWGYANTGRENPNYYKDGQYRTNCQTCTVVHELRRRGFNISAKGAVEGFNTIDEKIMNWRQRFLNHDNSDIKMEWSDDWKYRKRYMRMTDGRKKEFLIEKMPTDGRYEVYCGWKGGAAHVFNINRTNGKYFYFDAQSGNYGRSIEAYIKHMDGDSISVIRIDNKNINPEMCKAFNSKNISNNGVHIESHINNNSPGNLFSDIRKARNNKEKVELMRQFIEDEGNHFTKIKRYSDKNGSIYSSYVDEYDRAFGKGEMPKNLDMARKLSKKGYDVYMMPNPSDGNSFDFIVRKDDKLFSLEGKAFNGKDSLEYLLDKGAKQANRILVDVIGNTGTNYVYGCVNNAFMQNDISEIWLFKGSRLIQITRQMFGSKKFAVNFKKVWNK